MFVKKTILVKEFTNKIVIPFKTIAPIIASLLGSMHEYVIQAFFHDFFNISAIVCKLVAIGSCIFGYSTYTPMEQTDSLKTNDSDKSLM